METETTKKDLETSNGKQTIWNGAFINIFILNIVMSMAQFMLNALIPKYADFLGADPTSVGVVSSMFAVTAILMRPFAGPAIGHFKKNVLMAAALGFILTAYILYGFAYSVTMLKIGRLFHGIGMGLTGPLSLAMASDALPEKKLASGIGIFTLAQAISTAFGPSIGLKLVEVFGMKNGGYNKTFFICTVLMVCSIVLALCMKTGIPDRTKKFKISLNNIVAREILIPAVLMFLLSFAFCGLNAFIVIFGGKCGVEDIGLFFTAYAVSLLFTRPFSGKIADKYGLDKTLIPGLILFALSFVCISFSRSLPMFILSGVVSAFGYGVCQPAVQTLCMRLVPKERRGVASNTTYFGTDLGFLTAPPLAGIIITAVQKSSGNELLGYTVMFRLMIIPTIIGLALFLYAKRKLLQTSAPADVSAEEVAERSMGETDTPL